MPASIISKQHSDICIEPCSHLDCIAVRQIAVERCRICKDHIGFDLPFYSEVAAKVHKACLEAELAKKIKADEGIRFLTAEEVAKLLRVEPGTIRNWVSQNRIPYRKANGAIIFLLEEILAWTVPAHRVSHLDFKRSSK